MWPVFVFLKEIYIYIYIYICWGVVCVCVCLYIYIHNHVALRTLFSNSLFLSLSLSCHPLYQSFLVGLLGDPKACFSLATTQRHRRGPYFFSGIASLYPWSIPFFELLVWLNQGLNPSLSDHWWTFYPLEQWSGIQYIRRILPDKLIIVSTVYGSTFPKEINGSQVGKGSWIHWLHLCRGVIPPTSVLDMTLNNLIVRL